MSLPRFPRRGGKKDKKSSSVDDAPNFADLYQSDDFVKSATLRPSKKANGDVRRHSGNQNIEKINIELIYSLFSSICSEQSILWDASKF